MAYIRWYDKDEQLKHIMELLEKSSPEVKISVALDILQMLFNKNLAHSDNLIDDINEKYVPVRQRWYDESETLHSAVEMLRLISEEDRNDIYQEIMQSLLFFSEQDRLNKNNL